MRAALSTPVDSTPGTTSVTRRSVLAGITSVATAATAGCTAIIDTIADAILDEVNVFNETNRRLAGAIDIEAPDGTNALSETFDLAANTDDDSDSDTTATYGDVWGSTGTYEVTVELADGTDVRGQSRANEAVDIENTDEQMLAVALGAEETESGIYITVGKELSDFN